MNKWMSEFESVLREVHNTFWKQAYKRLSRKISSLASKLRIRSKEHDVACEVTTNGLRKMFLSIYGKECRYCSKILNYRNIACDHIIPLTKHGPSTYNNLQLICKTCNVRKGALDENDFTMLIELVQQLPDEISTYVMRKLAKGGRY